MVIWNYKYFFIVPHFSFFLKAFWILENKPFAPYYWIPSYIYMVKCKIPELEIKLFMLLNIFVLDNTKLISHNSTEF